MSDFEAFGLAQPILRAFAEEKYPTPTPIQNQTISLVLGRRDVIGIAQTGTGKTAAFALPILHHLQADRRRPERKTCRVLVLSPTRELSGQILDSFRAYGRHLGLTSALAIGGVPIGRQVRALMDGVDILVATPGRLLDLVGSNALRARRRRVPGARRSRPHARHGLHSRHSQDRGKAARPAADAVLLCHHAAAIAELADQMLRDPVKVAVAPPASTVERVEQRIIHLERAAKPAILADVLRDETIDRALVFTRTKHGADKVVRNLARAGIRAEAIHGNKSQSQRERVLAAFRRGEVRTLVATDIAARGIDVDGISHVVNYDLPNVPETYVHRIGRTARAGATGIAISLCDGEERSFLRDIEKLIRIAIPASHSKPGTAPARQDGGQPPRQEGGHPPRNAARRPAEESYDRGRRRHAGAPPQPQARPAQNGSGIAGVAFLNRDAKARRADNRRPPR